MGHYNSGRLPECLKKKWVSRFLPEEKRNIRIVSHTKNASLQQEVERERGRERLIHALEGETKRKQKILFSHGPSKPHIPHVPPARPASCPGRPQLRGCPRPPPARQERELWPPRLSWGARPGTSSSGVGGQKEGERDESAKGQSHHAPPMKPASCDRRFDSERLPGKSWLAEKPTASFFPILQ